MATHGPSRGLLRGSHLRQVSTASSLAVENSKVSNITVSSGQTSLVQPPESLGQHYLALSIHEESVSKDDVWLSLLPGCNVHYGDLLHFTVSTRSNSLPDLKLENEIIDSTSSLCFLYKAMDQDVLSKLPPPQISVSRRVAAAFGFEKGCHVVVSTANKLDSQATHVELVFRDQYLARADMWRLIVSEMTNTCIYRGQKVDFLGSVRAHIKNIFVRGRKVQSALFHPSTKPIFRSESARYVLFIQMSKEMWDFDAEGSGEIMFDKVINGFLPELFYRWHELKVKHLVSIVLFTRMIYEEYTDAGTESPKPSLDANHIPHAQRRQHSKDFYRVVVSDMASGEWADILNQLKQEFKVFLKDISIRKPGTGDHLPLGEGLSSALTDTPAHVIAGRPSAAIRGNLLEAINLGSSQFSSDYIDRDLIRTGVSIIVISPGAGVFEVDYDLLVATTENLIANGVGIDLVCLSKMPLHSVPLFKYDPPPTTPEHAVPTSIRDAAKTESTPTNSLLEGHNSETPPSSLDIDDTKRQQSDLGQRIPKETCSYGIPHWVDISFWTSATSENLTQKVIPRKSKDNSSFDTPQHKTFVPRVKMYELQMMGVMENEVSNISIPQISQTNRPTAGQVHNPKSIVTSVSPKTASRLSIASSAGSQYHGTQLHTPALSTSFASDQSGTEKLMRSHFQWMDDYDDLVFRHPLVAKKRSRRFRSTKTTSRSKQQHRYSPSLLGTSANSRMKPSSRNEFGSREGSHQGKEMLEHRLTQARSVKKEIADGKLSVSRPARPRTEKTARQISFGPRGLSTKAVASTGVTTQHGQGSLLSRGLKSGLSNKKARPSSITSPDLLKKSGGNATKYSDDRDLEVTQSSESESQQSRPIPIKNPTAIRISSDEQSRSKPYESNFHYHTTGGRVQDRLTALQDLREHEEDVPVLEAYSIEDFHQAPGALSPSTTLASWLTILNPSNPSKTKAALASRLGRWQHAFPRPLKASRIKWRSLCSPAAIPLTTEDFPSAAQLAEEYDGISYDIDLPSDSELSEVPRSLVAEILAFRLSRGFQIVVGPRLVESTKIPSFSDLNVLDEQILGETGSLIFLSRGSTLHRITRIDPTRIEVKQLFRFAGEAAKGPGMDTTPYQPFIRSTLAQDYEVQEISITPQRHNFDWKMIDAFIAGHERPQAQAFVENLRPWRARFVLIPVEASSSARRRQRSDEDDEEEIRLEGIRKLTQVWQRFRYIPPDERRYQAPLRNRKDTNPLDIMYQTRNPSAIVAAELENVAEGDGRPVQLLPESDLYQRSNFKIAGLAETIQSDKGVRMLDRRWHLRLHYNCFIGFELTSWLLQNFRDVDTRDEAVDLGNELMERGMFKHVEQRHNFRDGNYFYQIADEYRTPRPESRGWFGRSRASIPSTPMSEEVPKELPATGRSCSSSNSNSNEGNDLTTSVRKSKSLSVALSKSLIYDVDHRKRSYRPELINLHYDRLHNPDNCYHIRVEWMNTTPKLIHDAILSWATSVDRFGLRLVEVPLDEISSTTSTHPFRSPYQVKLAQHPPGKQPQSYFDNTSFAPQPKTERNFYQKAIMKRFNFVLDFEAASDFPGDVDVTFSWGKPDYRYPQYIHRSGLLIAQITHDGDFLLLANRLYGNRSAANASVSDTYRTDHSTEGDQNIGAGFFRVSPHRARHTPARPSPHDSPYSSPSVRATLDIPPSSANQSRGPSPTSSFPKQVDATRPKPTTSSTTPEALKNEFEAFCSNAEELSLFYEEVMSKPSTPGPNTPLMGSRTPAKAAVDRLLNESSIPALALPGRLIEKGKKGEEREKTTEAKTRMIGEQSPSSDRSNG